MGIDSEKAFGSAGKTWGVVKHFSLLGYFGAGNLGDAIQTIALSRLLPGILTAVDRMIAAESPEPNLVVNGWLGSNIVSDRPMPCVFAGVHLAQPHNLRWLRRSPLPIGTRDPYTSQVLNEAGIPNEMIGCASLTFPRYDGPRSGECAIEAINPPESALKLTHHIPIHMNWQEQWYRALSHLDIYRRASVVYTNRLHVALPCLAFGTPVVFNHDNTKDNRLSLLQYLGFVQGEPVTMEVSEIANRYRAFLETNLEIKIEEHDPEFPRV